tara:strand:- start:63 stop:467 length:405 start_codon:yes stop_codon:yes gene_type:complete
MSDKENESLLAKQLSGLQTHLNKFINRIEGDEFTVGLIDEIKNNLKAIDTNSESANLNSEHFNKLIKFSKEICKKMQKYSEYMSNVNIRYTSSNANKKLLDRVLDEFKLEEVNITVQLPNNAKIKEKEETVEKK